MPHVVPFVDDLCFDPNSPRLKLIAGDASDRKFYRMRRTDDSVICMQFPSWQGGYGGDPLSWLGMHRVLEKWKIPVPQVLKVDEKNACIWTEDLGDEFLNAHLGAEEVRLGTPDSNFLIARYREALHLLVTAQYPPPELCSEPHPASDRYFNKSKLLFELEFFGQHFLESLLNLEKAVYAHEWSTLAQELAARPRVLCHRDYHARNLLIHKGQLFWIDFQDARMGPHCYDLVSLVRDSYVKFHPETRESLVAHYFSLVQEARATRSLAPLDPQAFRLECLLMGLQRSIKALGSFAYLHKVKGKKVYLSFIRHTLQLIAADPEKATLAARFPKTLTLIDELHAGRLFSRLQGVLIDARIDSF